MAKHRFGVGIATLIIAFGWIALHLGPSAFAQGPPPPQVTVASPLVRSVSEWDEFTGRFVADESVEVRSRVEGFIASVSFRDGEFVKKGQPLFTIDKRPYAIALDIARAEVARAEAQLELARSDVERARPLVASRAIPERELDSRQAQLRVTQAQLASARANVRNAELNLEWCEVRAPIDGRLSDRRVDVGNLVTTSGPSGSTLLTTIVRIDPIKFEFDAAETDFLKYSRVARDAHRPSSSEAGNPVQVRLADEKTWTRDGRIDFVDNVLNVRAGTIRGRAVFANPDMLLTPGMFGRLRLWAGDAPALLVPDSSIASDQARKVVLTVGPENQVVGKVVTLGPLEAGLRVIRSGLEPTDRVIISGQASPFVRPGGRVVPNQGEIKPAEKPQG